MLRLGTDTGSLVNHVLSRSPAEPKVGDGATILMWTDRQAATIVKVTKTQVHVRADRAVRTDENGMSESQSYEHYPDPSAPVIVFRKTKTGYRNASGNGLRIGSRDHYHDFSF
jgi:hypothetical protein